MCKPKLNNDEIKYCIILVKNNIILIENQNIINEDELKYIKKILKKLCSMK